MGVKDLAQAEAEYPGRLKRLLAHPVEGLENYRELFDELIKPNGAIKVFCEVPGLASLPICHFSRQQYFPESNQSFTEWVRSQSMPPREPSKEQKLANNRYPKTVMLWFAPFAGSARETGGVRAQNAVFDLY